MVRLSSLVFEFSKLLTINCHLSRFSLSLFCLNQLKSGIYSSYNCLKAGLKAYILVDSVRSVESKTSHKEKY